MKFLSFCNHDLTPSNVIGITYANTTILNTFIVSKSSLIDIESTVFRGMGNLLLLSLGKNKLVLQSQLFQGLLNLLTLNLERN